MRESYRSVERQASVETEVRRSRFIACCRPLTDEESATAFVRERRKLNPDASHHVYAWILGGTVNLQRSSDDGEPSGTGGLPVLQSLRQPGIDNAGVVVSRFFGGTLLGAAGLQRAYGDAARRAVEAAGPVDYRLCRTFWVRLPYRDLERFERTLGRSGIECLDRRFAAEPELLCAVPAGQAETFPNLCAEISSGAAEIQPDGLLYRPLPPPDPPPESPTPKTRRRQTELPTQ